ncbi:putative disease resistance RPP13-like protein 1 [Papaver somniferum]|uniref:putative disease resistance RPP13-like protein 1 n=1 Tax=Papaver somniferum TaxID=3469 RepID=UPI000E6F5597|nr:putative disease resistance RPP13-like protein 1 [Papaver somniferum]
MAEGFLQSNEVKNTRSFEDVGNDYFKYLLWNSFFQDTVKDKLGIIDKFKMHGLVHDLAMSVVDRNEFGFDGKEDVSQVRRLQLICGKGSSTTTAEVPCKAMKLRTVVALDPENYSEINSLFSSKRLRVWYPLGGWYTKLSFSIPEFKHLRFLDLTSCAFDLSHHVSLNPSHNLQTLILHGCKTVSGFLGQTGPSRNLRHLDVSGSDIEVLHEDFIVNFNNLQTLDLHGCTEFKALPENIGLLRHLSYLNLSTSHITKIPDSITGIRNLMTLDFSWCTHLVALPTELGAFTRLRSLDLSRTEIKVLPESCISNLCKLEIVDFGIKCELSDEIKNWPNLREFRHSRYGDTIPRGMSKLTCLETLVSFSVCGSNQNKSCSGQSGLEELATLNSLQVLWITSLENVMGGIEDAEGAKLKDKPDLRDLYLIWSSHVDGDMVLEGLQPHPNLRNLQINRFSGFKLSKWMCSTSNRLVSLNLKDCNVIEKLPALGMLPCLRDLEIWEMKSVKCLGREFYYHQEEEEESRRTQVSTTCSFPSLLYFKMFFLESLEEWVSRPSSDFYVDSFPVLARLHIQGCLKLRSAPNSFPSLKELELRQIKCKAVKSI